MATKKKRSVTAVAKAAAASSASTGRFVISNRLAGRDTEASKRSRSSLDTTFKSLLAGSVSVIGDTGTFAESDERRVIVFDATADEIAQKVEELGADTIVEPEYPRLTQDFTLSEVATRGALALPSGSGASVQVRLTSAGKPVADVGIILLLASLQTPATSVTQNVSGADGSATLTYDPSVWTPKMLVVQPKSSYWSVVINAPGANLDLQLVPLPKTGPLGWWQALAGNPDYSETRAQGMRIGVIDTGVGPHPYLDHVTGIGAFLGGTFIPGEAAAADVENHGTHVSGIIGARPAAGSGNFGGIASGAEVFVARVFASPSATASQGDIAAAIDALSQTYSADLLNLSLGGAYSEIELDAVVAAVSRGTLCICAAGNGSGGPVLYPAALPQTVAVSALGLLSQTPPRTESFANIPTTPDKFGVPPGLFFPIFNNVGPQIRCTGAGNGIISTVPVWNDDPVPYVEMSGTSMATPAATAAAAVRLAQDQTYRSLPRNANRAIYALRSILSGAVPVGLVPDYVGLGLARV